LTAFADVDASEVIDGEHEFCVPVLDAAGTKICDVWVTFAVNLGRAILSDGVAAEMNGAADTHSKRA